MGLNSSRTSYDWAEMLLSLFLSFLFAREFRAIKYVLLMIVIVVLVSLFSMGVPIAYDLRIPYPFSFPFYAHIEYAIIEQSSDFYSLNFLTFQIIRDTTPASFGLVCLYYSFFLSINLVGAIIGYWIKLILMDRYEEKTLINS